MTTQVLTKPGIITDVKTRVDENGGKHTQSFVEEIPKKSTGSYRVTFKWAERPCGAIRIEAIAVAMDKSRKGERAIYSLRKFYPDAESYVANRARAAAYKHSFLKTIEEIE